MMKSKPFLFSCALLLGISAALWGVNYQLDHPPLSKADKKFRARVAGANRVEVSEHISNPVKGSQSVNHQELNEKQTRELISHIRLLDSQPRSLQVSADCLTFVFWKNDQVLRGFDLHQNKNSSRLLMGIEPDEPLERMSIGGMRNSLQAVYEIHPRFEKPLRRALDVYVTEHKINP